MPLTAQKFDSFQYYVVDGIVYEAVKDDFPLPTAFYNACTFQKTKLMGNCGLVYV